MGLLIAGALQAAMTIDVVFTDTADGSWDAVTRGVVNQAIADWENEIVGIDDGFGGVASINVQFEAEFFNFGNGGPLGMWSGPLSASVGSNIRPWEATDASYTIAHTIRFNSSSINSGATNELWFDATPADDGSDKAFSDWDALTVARHEIGHMLGFSSAYADDVGLPSQSNPWSDKIIGDVFDPGGLNVAMEPGDVAHVLDDSLLMDTSLSNAEGGSISRCWSLTCWHQRTAISWLRLRFPNRLALWRSLRSQADWCAVVGVASAFQARGWNC
ncbi:hypothetical protein C2E31_01820 [Rhodopirellula baltica]|nr:hypothetical protein C2E31_01820 [Rhodopirellula baltica]